MVLPVEDKPSQALKEAILAGGKQVRKSLCTFPCRSQCSQLSHVTDPTTVVLFLHLLLCLVDCCHCCVQAILKAMQTYVSELRSGVPAQQSSTGAAAAATAAAEPAAKSAASAGSNGVSAASAASAPAAAKSKSRCTVKLTEKFYARSLDIFECFTVQGRVQAFTRSPAVVEPQPGGSFSWFNGHVQVGLVHACLQQTRSVRPPAVMDCMQPYASTLPAALAWLLSRHVHEGAGTRGQTLCWASSCLVCAAACVLWQGKFEELQPGKQLMFSWRFNNWEDGCYSKVT